MSALQPTDQLRSGALELLASGNSIESVAHVFGVSVDVVTSWQMTATRALPVGSVAAQAHTIGDSEHATGHSSPIRFDLTLDYSTSTAYRRTMFWCAICVLGGWAWALFMMSEPPVSKADIGLMCMVTLGMASGALPLFKLSRVSLVLDENGISVPGLFRDTRMPYSDLLSYSIEPGGFDLGRNTTLQGETLRIRSRNPRVDVIEVFIDENYPLDGDIVSRLDEVCRANHAPRIPGSNQRHPFSDGV